MEILTIGVGERLRICKEELLRLGAGARYPTSVLLPIPTTRDGETVTGTETRLAEIRKNLSGGCAVIGYGIPSDIRADIERAGAAVIDLSLDEGFLSENSAISARGALGYLLTHTKRDVGDMRIGIVGYGRIGSRMTADLLFLGARPRVLTRRESVVRELCAEGVAASLPDEEELFCLDVLINTTPSKLFSDGAIGRFLEHGSILDLASGSIFPKSEGVTKLSSVPETMYPESGGRLYAKYVLKYLEKEALL